MTMNTDVDRNSTAMTQSNGVSNDGLKSIHNGTPNGVPNGAPNGVSDPEHVQVGSTPDPESKGEHPQAEAESTPDPASTAEPKEPDSPLELKDTLLSKLTPDQRSTLESFRAGILKEFPEFAPGGGGEGDGNAIGVDDPTLIRFLRARSFNLKQSMTMYRNCLQWRRTVLGVGMEELYRRTDPWDYPERDEVFSKWPIWFHKTDKMGRPINIQTFGAIDIPALHKAVPPQRHWETVVVNAESMTREVLPAASKASGKEITSSMCIIDLKGFGLSQFWGMKSLVRDSFQISQDYYPETMGRLLVINAPTSFTVIWNVVKPWLAKETVGKIDIVGGDYREVLLGVVDEENLPERFGGRCRCEGGCEKSNAGPWLDARRSS